MPDKPQSPDNERLELVKLDKIIFANRAPNSSDKGMFWVRYTANNDTTMVFYARHPFTGTWRSSNLT